MKLLTITRILHQSSKKGSYDYKNMFFERFDFGLHDVYRALSHFSKINTECQRFTSDQINAKYAGNTTLMYFDVTNFHFEIDETDNLRKRVGDRDKRINSYVFSFSIRKGTKDFKRYVLDYTGYVDRDGKPLKEEYDYKIKSRIEVQGIQVTMKNGSQKSITKIP